MNLGTIAYLPPSHEIGYVKSFVENLGQYRTRHPVLTFSECNEFQPSCILRTRPAESVQYRNVPLSVNNFVFLTAIDMAVERGLEYFLYAEADCRMRGNYWDEKIFMEFFQTPNALAGGTPSVWNIGICKADAAIKSTEFLMRLIKKTGRPGLVWQSTGREFGPIGMWAYVNGALGVYHTATVDAIFGARKMDKATFCTNMGAWDVFIGKGLWNEFDLGIFDRIAIIPSVYSGYKDCHYALHERKKMLMDKDVVAVHQIKESWIPDNQHEKQTRNN